MGASFSSENASRVAGHFADHVLSSENISRVARDTALRSAEKSMKVAAIKMEVLFRVRQDGDSLRYQEGRHKADKEIVLTAVRQSGSALKYAAEHLKADRKFILEAVQQSGNALEYAAVHLKADTKVVLAAVQQCGSALKYAAEHLKSDKKFVLEAVQQSGLAIKYAAEHLKTDKGFMSEVVQQTPNALEYVSDVLEDLKIDKEFLLATVCQSGNALKYAAEHLKADKEVVVTAIKQSGYALEYAAEHLKTNKEFILGAVQQSGKALKYAAVHLKADKEVVLKAVGQSGLVLKYAAESLRSDKDVVMTAVAQEGASLKYALPPLNQDQDCLRAAGFFDGVYDSLAAIGAKRMVFSTKFSLSENTQHFVNLFALTLKEHEFARDKIVYLPNSWGKFTCDPDWTNINHPCRGTMETCSEFHFQNGVPIEHRCCWRASFVYQLLLAKKTGGFMVQLAEYDDEKDLHVLGNGQQIETELAEQVGVKVFRVYQQLRRVDEDITFGVDTNKESVTSLVEQLVNRANRWDEGWSSNLRVDEIRLQNLIGVF